MQGRPGGPRLVERAAELLLARLPIARRARVGDAERRRAVCEHEHPVLLDPLDALHEPRPRDQHDERDEHERSREREPAAGQRAAVHAPVAPARRGEGAGDDEGPRPGLQGPREAELHAFGAKPKPLVVDVEQPPPEIAHRTAPAGTAVARPAAAPP